MSGSETDSVKLSERLGTAFLFELVDPTETKLCIEVDAESVTNCSRIRAFAIANGGVDVPLLGFEPPSIPSSDCEVGLERSCVLFPEECRVSWEMEADKLAWSFSMGFLENRSSLNEESGVAEPE
jgi:hypothetical protein